MRVREKIQKRNNLNKKATVSKVAEGKNEIGVEKRETELSIRMATKIVSEMERKEEREELNKEIRSNPEKKWYIEHINGHLNDNRLRNLRWVRAEEKGEETEEI